MKDRGGVHTMIRIEHTEILDAILDMSLSRPPKDLRECRSKHTPHQGAREMARRRRQRKALELKGEK